MTKAKTPEYSPGECATMYVGWIEESDLEELYFSDKNFFINADTLRSKGITTTGLSESVEERVFMIGFSHRGVRFRFTWVDNHDRIGETSYWNIGGFKKSHPVTPLGKIFVNNLLTDPHDLAIKVIAQIRQRVTPMTPEMSIPNAVQKIIQSCQGETLYRLPVFTLSPKSRN